MVTVPAFLWRGGFASRALLAGGALGAALGAVALLDSGMWQAGLCVFVILGIAFGIVNARRMNRYWPGASELDGADRVAVVRAARRGEPVPQVRLAAAVSQYSKGLHAAAESARPIRWVIGLVLIAAFAMALWDSMFGAIREGVSSAVYLVFILLEFFWWPKRLQTLLANADQAALRSSRDCRPDD